MFYSNTIFKSLGNITGVEITFYVGVVNFISTFGGLFLLFRAGRRTIMLSMSAVMAVILVLVGFCSLKQARVPSDESNPWTYPTLLLVMAFIAAFEFSSGPITWLYMAEIMQDKSTGIATVLNWLMNLIISIITPGLIDMIGEQNVGVIFISMGILTTLGTIFIYFFMLETRGKTPQQIEELFNPDRTYSKVNMDRKIIADDYESNIRATY